MHDRERFERLFADHGRDVLAYASRRTDAATAEEIVAEVFVVAWRRRRRVPKTEPVLWLFGVARRLLANEWRAARRRDALAERLSALARDRAADDAAGGPHPLWEALSRLKPLDREVLMLTAWEGLDGAQAGVVLGCSAQAVHTRLHRARARLAAELDRDVTRSVS
ncbi:RNA polymerase sigma factor [Solirubrobacter ginsenosidimutans]|uniref:RNA polymerase sigma factor n=1 Tax=Solirubrobacter ginsenosidimutans TaxID=490573 RepID=A0A9X3S1C2_9ACTN|nr:RNA polymerase sigma factor [Solirubrobacter ginsenosidimutans]MDA0160907.1 RNA polymerase sigma factor [Solirubrobacter ginsenosidimutans]